jgi:hypothetical protein
LNSGPAAPFLLFVIVGSSTAMIVALFSKSLTKHFKGSGSGFTELHAKLDADTLLDFAIHRREALV